MSGEDQVEKIGSALWDRPDPGFLWKRFLAGASTDGQGVRRWIFWIWWSRPRTLPERFIAIRRVAFSPLIAVVEAGRAVRRYGEKVVVVHGVSRAKQFAHLMSLQYRTGMAPIAYYMYQLFRADRRPSSGQYLMETGKVLQVLSRRMPPSPDLAIFVNKASFEMWCRQHGFQTVSNLMEFRDGRVTYRADTILPPQDLFSKPSNAQRGEGVLRWTCKRVEGALTWESSAGGAYSAESLEKYLSSLSLGSDRPFVLQPRLRNHQHIERLANGSLSTVRLMTLRPAGGRAQPLLAVLRLPTGGSVADNFDLGGLGAAIDLASGRLGPAVFKRGQYPLEQLDYHPDTRMQIAGETLPFWQECVDLGVRAHDEILTPMPVIGWDIAILEDGPVLIEANHMPGPELAQMTTGAPLGATSYAKCVIECMRRFFSL